MKREGLTAMIIVGGPVLFLIGMVCGSQIHNVVSTECSYENRERIAKLVAECPEKDTNKRGCVDKAYRYYCE